VSAETKFVHSIVADVLVTALEVIPFGRMHGTTVVPVVKVTTGTL
jgi:hypothetical protein